MIFLINNQKTEDPRRESALLSTSNDWLPENDEKCDGSAKVLFIQSHIFCIFLHVSISKIKIIIITLFIYVYIHVCIICIYIYIDLVSYYMYHRYICVLLSIYIYKYIY